MTFPTTMTGFDRTYLPPRGIRADIGPVTAWQLFDLEQDEKAGNWATATLTSLIASVDQEAVDALGCTDCGDTGFYGVAEPDDPDMLSGLIRRTGQGTYQALQTIGCWDDWDPKSVPLEVLSLDLAGDLAAAITGGASGLLRRYGAPRAWLPPAPVVAASPLTDVLCALTGATPQSEWVNFAVVDEADQGAVFDVVRVRVASGADVLERWELGTWTPDEDLLVKADLPMVRLDEGQLAGVQAQMESAIVADAPLTVSPDPRAEKLRRYWSTGRGAVKIRWNTPGDAKRCHKHLEKYMPGRAWAYCQNLHKRNTGVWTGSRFNVGGNGHHKGHFGVRGSALDVGAGAPVQVAGATHPRPFGSVHHIFRVGDVVKFVPAQTGATPAPPDVLTSGDQFEVRRVDVSPVQTQGVAGAGGIQIVKDVIELVPVRDRPYVDEPSSPVSQPVPKPGRGMSVPVPVEGSGPPPSVIRQNLVVRLELADNQFRRAGLHEADVVPPAHTSLQASGDALAVIDATSHEFYCTHSTCGWRSLSPEEMLLASLRSRRSTGTTEGNTTMTDLQLVDGEYRAVDIENEGLIAAITAGAIPVAPPDEWFEDPKLDKPTTITVDDTGRVYGHLAPWDITHIGMAGEVPPPPNPDKQYRYFRTGQLVTASGGNVRVGQLTLAGGHAPTRGRRLTTAEVVKHYDDTATGVADVAAGEDEHGIWVAGALRPTVTPEQIRVMRACPPSGDWRDINGNLELVAACHVNVQGFPIAASGVAGGATVALVAAGARTMAELMAAERADKVVLAQVAELRATVESLVASAAVAEAPAVEPEATDNPAAAATTEVEEPSSVSGTSDEGAEQEVQLTEAELAQADKIAKARELAATIRKEVLRGRKNEATTAALPPQFLANKKGKESTDSKASTIKGTDSFPISDVASLKKAIQAFGRAGDKDAAKKHIMSMAYKLKRPDLIPSNWKK